MVVSRRAFLGGVVLLPAVVAACGGAAPPPDTAATSAGKPLPAEAWRAFAEELQQRAAAGAFSGAVLVAHDGQPLLEQGYGLADRQHRRANAAQTKFPIASLGRMFTGVAIAQLVEQDKLSFTDTIGTHLAGFPPQIADQVTIHSCSPTPPAWVTPPSGGDPNRPPRWRAWIAKAPLQFQPGSRFAYSNDGFIVLGAFLERRTRQDYADFADQRINGVRIVGHNGGSPGYEAQLDLYPDRGDVVVILTNHDQVLTPVLRRSEEMLTR